MEWFKFRMCWRRSLMLLSDEEAGRVIKALVNYVDSDEEQETGGVGDILLSLMAETVKGDMCQYMEKARKKAETSEKRKAAGRKSGEARRAKSEQNPTHVQQSLTGVNKCSAPVQADEHLFSGVPLCSVLFGKNTEYKNTEDKNTENRTPEEKEERYSEAREQNSLFCSELPSADSELPAVEIPLNDGVSFPLFRKDLDEYAALYPAVNIEQELRNIRGWCLANPGRRKTRRGVRRFINGWLSRAQDRSRPVPKPDAPENPFLKYATGEAEIGGILL